MTDQPKVTDLQKDLIIAEYNYIAQTAFQCNEDRARVSQVYYGTFGTLLVATVVTDPSNANFQQLHMVFGLLFLINALFGVITILQLAKLRSAWRVAVKTMNHLKEEAFADKEKFDALFLWQTPPKAFLPSSISFINSAMTALLTGVSAAACVIFWSTLGNNNVRPEQFGLGIFVGLVVVLGCYILYRERVKKQSPNPPIS